MNMANGHNSKLKMHIKTYELSYTPIPNKMTTTSYTVNINTITTNKSPSNQLVGEDCPHL